MSWIFQYEIILLLRPSIIIEDDTAQETASKAHS